MVGRQRFFSGYDRTEVSRGWEAEAAAAAVLRPKDPSVGFGSGWLSSGSASRMKPFFTALAALLITSVAVCQAAVPIVMNRAAVCPIYRALDAPDSVKAAASELQRYVHEVTGVQLSIVDTPMTPMIALGASPSATNAGVTAQGLPLEGFRIATRGQNLYIVGPDTPMGQTTPQGGTSNGTRNGTYAFIERYLGVRWLMPGEHGDYVPHLVFSPRNI